MVTLTTHLSLWTWPLSWLSHFPARPNAGGGPQCWASASGAGCRQRCCWASRVHSALGRGCPLLVLRAGFCAPSCCCPSGTQSRHAHIALLSHSRKTETETTGLLGEFLYLRVLRFFLVFSSYFAYFMPVPKLYVVQWFADTLKDWVEDMAVDHLRS